MTLFFPEQNKIKNRCINAHKNSNYLQFCSKKCFSILTRTILLKIEARFYTKKCNCKKTKTAKKLSAKRISNVTYLICASKYFFLKIIFFSPLLILLVDSHMLILLLLLLLRNLFFPFFHVPAQFMHDFVLWIWNFLLFS